MKEIKRFFERIGLGGTVVAFSALAAIGFAIYGLVGGSQLSEPLLVGVLGLLLLEVLFQHERLESAKDDIINSLKGVRVEIFSSDKDFADAKYRQLLTSKNFVHDMELCLPMLPSRPAEVVAESPFRKLLNERVMKGELTYKYVQVIYDRTQFESVLRKLFRFSKYRYYLGYFVGAPEVAPVLNLMNFDDEHFFMGGYYGPTVRGQDRNVHIQHDLIGQTFRQYYDYLWSKARIFNDNRIINWSEVRDCGLKLGYSLDELNATIAQIAKEVGFSDSIVLK